MVRPLAFVVVMTIAGCVDSEPLSPAPDAGRDGGFDAGTVSECSHYGSDEVDVSLVGTTPHGDGSEFVVSCVSGIGWGDCGAGEVDLIFIEDFVPGPSGAPVVLNAEIQFDGLSDGTTLSRPCSLRVGGDAGSIACIFDGAFDLTAGEMCPSGHHGASLTGTFSVTTAGFDVEADVDVTICSVAICI